MGLDGTSYFYNNPLKVQGGIERRSWYEVPCCPSNLSRTIGNLQQDILNVRENAVEIGQYISSRHTLELGNDQVMLAMESDLPWGGAVRINLQKAEGSEFTMKLRQPSWAADVRLWLNGDILEDRTRQAPDQLAPSQAEWITITRRWNTGDQVALEFGMPVRILHADARVRSVRGKSALARGPLVYCLESIDNPDVDIFSAEINSESVQTAFAPDLLGGIWQIKAETTAGLPVAFIPYHLWGNRGPSQMTVFVTIKEEHHENTLAA
jgi:DUF1680 family protein